MVIETVLVKPNSSSNRIKDRNVEDELTERKQDVRAGVFRIHHIPKHQTMK